MKKIINTSLKCIGVMLAPFAVILYYILFSNALLYIAPDIKLDDLISISIIVIIVVIVGIIAYLNY